MASNLINEHGKVLAAIDASVYAISVADHAAWAASRLSAPLELVHAIERTASASSRDLSGSLVLGEQEYLLSELARVDEQRSKLLHERGRHLLERAREHIASSSGIQAGVRQRHGSIEDALLDLEAETRLYVLGKRGEHADFTSGRLGGSLERIVRGVQRPILVASRAFGGIQRFLIAFDGSPTTRKCVDMVCASPLLQGLHCAVLLVGEATAEANGHLDWARARLQAAGFDPAVHLVPGTAEAVISRMVKELAAELLVMGAYGHSRIRQLVVGSTTAAVMRSCPIPLLLLR